MNHKILFFKFRFVEPPVLDMAAVVEDSSTRTPLIFVLSPGVVGFIQKRANFAHINYFALTPFLACEQSFPFVALFCPIPI